jgi:hypothetical protein
VLKYIFSIGSRSEMDITLGFGPRILGSNPDGST